MRKITLLLSMLVLSVLAFAQRTVTGTVRDEKGDPIPFATISEVGKTNVAKADANGAFSIKVADGAQLSITASGHQPQTVTVSGNTVTATLTTTNQQLTEVVVTTALGQQRQAKAINDKGNKSHPWVPENSDYKRNNKCKYRQQKRHN